MLSPVRPASTIDRMPGAETAPAEAATSARNGSILIPTSQLQAATLNSPVAGKLNMLVLAVRTQMIQALLDVLQQLSKSLGLIRRQGESDAAFAARVAEAISKMDGNATDSVDLPLAADKAASVPLRILADALANPAGPQAQKVITYLETLNRPPLTAAYSMIEADPLEQQSSLAFPADEEPLVDAEQLPPSAGEEEPASPTVVDRSVLNRQPSPDSGRSGQAQMASRPPLTAASVQTRPSSATAPEPQSGHQLLASATEPTRDLHSQPAAGLTGAQSGTKLADQAPAHHLQDTASVPSPREDAQQQLTARANEDQPVGKAAVLSEPAVPKAWPGIAAVFSRISSEQLATLFSARPLKIMLEGGLPILDMHAVEEIEAAVHEALRENHEDAAVLVNSSTRAAPQSGASPAAGVLHEEQALALPSEDPDMTAQEVFTNRSAPPAVRVFDGIAYVPQPYPFTGGIEADEDPGAFYREDANRDEHQSEDGEETGEGPQEEQHDEPQISETVPSDDEKQEARDGASRQTEEPARLAPQNSSIAFSFYEQMAHLD
ncbi:hypothetical protein [Oryzifoliimicrobium ureilyticus]|uniref:hypothetical protein n=1 Tax=Oryzifoliimicrobium ureilyticus TaxID=3113724 RepID=UPI00307661A5